MAWEEGLESNNTVIIALLNTTKESVVQVRGIIAVAVAVGHDTRVNTGGVAVPDLEECLGHRLAGIDVDDLDVERERHTLAVFSDIFPDKLALNPVRTLCDLGSQDTGVVASEEDGRIRVDGDTSQVGLVGRGKNSVEVTNAEVRFLWPLCQSRHSLLFDGASGYLDRWPSLPSTSQLQRYGAHAWQGRYHAP